MAGGRPARAGQRHVRPDRPRTVTRSRRTAASSLTSSPSPTPGAARHLAPNGADGFALTDRRSRPPPAGASRRPLADRLAGSRVIHRLSDGFAFTDTSDLGGRPQAAAQRHVRADRRRRPTEVPRVETPSGRRTRVRRCGFDAQDFLRHPGDHAADPARAVRPRAPARAGGLGAPARAAAANGPARPGRPRARARPRGPVQATGYRLTRADAQDEGRRYSSTVPGQGARRGQQARRPERGEREVQDAPADRWPAGRD